jgi:hypothetical protein
MRLTVPEPKITLYEDGFEGHDQLGRKKTGDKLSDLVERIDDPLVIALDGAWGSGKSFFLKCWVGEHLKRDGNNTQTVYFDAFQHDFLDDPLIALTDAIATRFEKDEKLSPAERTTRVEKLKKFGWVLGKSSAKIGVSVAGHYAKKLVGEECLEEFGKELEKASEEGVATLEGEVKTLIDSGIGKEEAETFWREQRAKIVAMAAFREVLAELTEPNDKGEPTRKLVIVVDELDRCRPDYALSLLEIIKHFFNVDGVHFVLGVNLKELQNSVRARYGNGVDAAKYLQKFVSVICPLTGPKLPLGDISAYSRYFEHISDLTGFSSDPRFKWLRDYLLMIDHHADVSLRDIETLVAHVTVALPEPFDTEGSRHLYAGLSILRVIRPELIAKARFNELDFDAADRIFKLLGRDAQPEFFKDAYTVWSACTSGPSGGPRSNPATSELERLGLNKINRQHLQSELVARCFDAFVLPTDQQI